MGDPRREGGGILTREETRDRLSFSSSSSSPLSLMYDRKGGGVVFPRMRQKEQYKFGHKSGRARIVLDCRRNARNCTLSVARKGCPWGGEGRDVFIMRQNLLFLLFLVWGRPVWCLGYCNLHQRGLETRGLEIGGGGGMFWRRGWEER